jgi:hypothetical protein
MSCSDKVWKWSKFGLQGRLLGSVLPQPVPLASVVIGSVVVGAHYNQERMEFALVHRGEADTVLSQGLSVSFVPLPPLVLTADIGKFSVFP